MNTSTPQTQYGAGLGAWLDQQVHFYTRDLDALSDEQIFNSVGGKARTPFDFTTEVAMMMDWTTTMLSSNETPAFPDDATKKAIEEANKSKAALIELVKSSGAKLKEALANVSQERLDTIIDAPFGMTMPAAALANIFVNHLWYHDGQLNLIQAINGDAEMHWM
ncbi:MAG: DinB family protein [Armatimonadetes bacterium]|nr:DinB family protein [Armatimonadota bacterium]